MKVLALSGSTRAASTNTALLRTMAECAPIDVKVSVFDTLARLPIVSPDLEGPPAPEEVEAFARAVAAADGLVIAYPEYVHALPGGFKNAIDWLVSREEIIAKPIALIHASHRGEDALASLRLVLAAVSKRFAPDIFERFALTALSPAEVETFFARPENAARLRDFPRQFTDFVGQL